MAPLDIFIIVIGLFLLVRGYLHGFVRGIASLGGLVLAVLVAIRFQPMAQDLLDQSFGPSPYHFLAAFVVLFVTTFVAVAIIGIILMKLISISPLGGIDRVLGILLGGLKAAVVIMLTVFLLAYFLGPSHPLVAKSRAAPYAIQMAGWCLGHLPEGVSSALSQAKDMLDQNRPQPRKDKSE